MLKPLIMAAGAFLLVLGGGWASENLGFFWARGTGLDPSMPYTTYGVMIAAIGAALLAYGYGMEEKHSGPSEAGQLNSAEAVST